MKNTLTKRTLSILLCAVMLLSYLPAGLLQASAASVQAGILFDQSVADPSTLNAWKDTAFNPYNLTTEHAGGVWTDKTVVKAGDAGTVFVDKNGNSLGITAGTDNFLVALSALGANSVVAGQASTPTDTIFVLDVSNSMADTDLDAMVSATNDAIHSLLTANAGNRVGVVVYSTNVSTLLPLDRYTPVQKGYGSNRTTAYIEMANNHSQIRTARTGYGNNSTYVKNSAGQNVTTSISASGATYIQGGLWQAYQMFNNATVTDTRTPIMVLMSDGAPSYGTEDYNDVSSRDVGNGGTNSITDGLAFLTQLTAAYVKEKIGDKYNTTAYFYSVGLGVSESGQNVSIAEAVLDTSKTRTNPENWWNTYLGLANKTNKTMSFNAAGEYVSVTYDATVTAASKNYTDRYFPASDASQLGAAFQGIVNEINLKASYNVTRIEGTDANTGGYVSFIDEIGTGMEVKGIKGILIGDTLYTGANLAKALLNSEFGTAENPTELGNNMVWALKQLLSVSDLQLSTGTITATERIHDLIQKAYDAGQIAYNSQTGAFSNMIGWFSDANGDYLGFWDFSDPNFPIPAGAAYANTSYGMLGATTASQTAHASDMMYVAVMVSKKITQVDGAPALEARTPQMVTFRIPASLLPTVTYQINVDAADGEHITENTSATITYNAADPIRLVYEVGVHSQLTPENIHSFLREGYASKDNQGNYYLYTNAWYWEPSTGVADPNNPPTKDNAVGKDVLYDTGKNHITYAYFEPSAQNEHYYFTEDTDLYTYNGTSYEKLTTAPVTDGSVQYYFQHRTFVSKSPATQTGVEVDAKVNIHYGKVSQKLIADNTNYGVNATSGVYYIKEGTMHYETIHEHDNDKAANATGSFQYRMHQLVDIAVDGNNMASHHFDITYLGNNGRVTYSPAQGFTLNKVMAQGATATGEFTFDVTVSSDTDGKYTETRDGVSTVKDITGGAFTLTLAAGQSVTVTGLDVGAVYTVTEREREGYQLGGIVVSAGSVSGATATGTVANNQLHSITYTNDLQGYGNLLVTKNVTYNKGSQPQTDPHTFQITATFNGLAGKTVYANGNLITLNANGAYTFALTNGGQMLFTGIPDGTVYTVTEDASTLTAGYAVTAGTFSGAIVKDETAVAGVQNTYTPEDVVLNSTDPAITVTVNKEVVVSLGYSGYLLGQYDFLFHLQRYNAATGQWDPLPGNNIISISNPDDPSSSYYNNGEDNRGSVAIDLSGLPFSSVGEHFFRISEEIPANLQTGWTYDRTHHDFAVVVTDTELDGKLEIAEVKRVDDTVSITPTDTDNDTFTDVWNVSTGFTNSYVVNSTKLTIAAKKTLTGATLTDGQFNFALYKTGANFDITGITPITAKNGVGGDIVFTSETYPFVSGDTYYYYVMQETSTDGNGITTDKTVWEIMVTVSGPSTGNAEIKGIQYRKQGDTGWTNSVTGAPADNLFNSISFNNTYAAAATTVQLVGNKTLTNLTPGIDQSSQNMTVPASTYQFKLEAVTATAPMPAETEVFAAAGGAIPFGTISYTAAGVYEYKITENDTTVAGVTKDATVYTVKVTVVDNGLGQLVATPTYWIGDRQVEQIVFNNTYTAQPVADLKIHADKVLNVGIGFDRPLNANDFRATLTHPDGTEETVYNDATGIFHFAALTFDTVGTYNYSVSEVIPAHAVNGIFNGVTYDAAVKNFSIVVEDNGAGNLVAKLNGTQTLSATSTLAATIENSYAATPASVHLLAHKDLEGRELAANEFSFLLTSVAGAPMPNNAAEVVVKNDENGDVDFGTITYNAVGTYQYKVTEQKLDENGNPLTKDPVTGAYVYKGVTYDPKVYIVTVVVLDQRNGSLTAHVSSEVENEGPQPGGVVFTNIYKAAPVTVNIEGDANDTGKIFTDMSSLNKKDLDDYEFRFVLAALDGTVIETVSDNGKGFTFADLTYTEVGTHQYLIYEIPTNNPGVIFDTSKYRVTVTVTDNGEGDLVAAVAYEKAESPESGNYAPVNGILFENTYKAKETSVSFAGQKTLTGGRKLQENDFSFILKNASGDEVETVKNKADGTFAFAAITYAAEGTYVYTLEEVKGNADGITYDTGKYTLTVTVTDVNGELVATTKITKDNADATSVGFTNIYTPKAVSTTISIQKELINKTAEKMGPDGFKFLLDGNNAQQTLTTDADGKASITLEFTAQDVGNTYTYKLSEIAGNTPYMVYDSTVYEITVKVTQAEDGQLQLSVERDGTGAFKFVNTYKGAPNPQTGDSMNLGLTAALMFSSIACLFVLVLCRKQLTEQKDA